MVTLFFIYLLLKDIKACFAKLFFAMIHNDAIKTLVHTSLLTSMTVLLMQIPRGKLLKNLYSFLNTRLISSSVINFILTLEGQTSNFIPPTDAMFS